jgi:hypothetical protein
MTLDEFEAALDLYGPALADWPEAQHVAAAAVLVRFPEATAMLAAAEEVATLLALTRTTPASAIDRIVMVATTRPQQRLPAPALRRPRAGWRYAACVAMALTGFALGLAEGSPRAVAFEPLAGLAFGPADPLDAF